MGIDILILSFNFTLEGFPCGSDSKESACKDGDPGSIHGSGRSPREGNGNPLQYSCLENSMDRGAWQPPVHGLTKSDMTDQLTFSLLLCSSSLLMRKRAQRVNDLPESKQAGSDRIRTVQL